MRVSLVPFRAAAPLLAAVVLAGVVGGCTSEQPQPEPVPLYEPVPRDLCNRLGVEDVASQFGLSVPSRYEPSDNYDMGRTDTYNSCRFASQADDERFATELGEFSPSGQVPLSVYREPEDAQDEYRMQSRSFETIQGSEPGASTAAVEGWWDDGMYVQTVRVVDEEGYDLDELDATRLDVTYVVRHKNLFLVAGMYALSPAGDTDEVTAILHEMVEALIEEAVSHLTVATDE